jgi:hypothetical protein
MPTAFIFTTSSGDAAEHAKTRMLRDLLNYVCKRCPNIIFTLSDKDLSEINACRAEFPQAKHQLCYWHGVTYVGERLAENKPPAAYNLRKAYRVFDFVDSTWAPGVTAVYPDDDEEGEGQEDGNLEISVSSKSCFQSN